MDVAGVVHGLQRLGRLAGQRQPIAVQQLAAADDQRVEARPVEKLHHDELLVVGRDAVRVRVHDPRMLNRRGDLAFGRLVEAFEAGLQRVGLGLVENLQADDLLGLAVAGHVEVRHRAGDRFAQDLVPAGDVDLAAFQNRFEELRDAHGEWVSK